MHEVHSEIWHVHFRGLMTSLRAGAADPFLVLVLYTP